MKLKGIADRIAVYAEDTGEMNLVIDYRVPGKHNWHFTSRTVDKNTLKRVSTFVRYMQDWNDDVTVNPWTIGVVGWGAYHYCDTVTQRDFRNPAPRVQKFYGVFAELDADTLQPTGDLIGYQGKPGLVTVIRGQVVLVTREQYIDSETGLYGSCYAYHNPQPIDIHGDESPMAQLGYKGILTDNHHHPDCQCNACYYGQDAATWLFNASEY